MPRRPKLPNDPDAEDSGPRLPAVSPQLEPGEPTDLELMAGIQREDPDALSQLYDRYNGIIKALILRVVHNEAEADDLLQEIFMELWNHAKNFSAQKGQATRLDGDPGTTAGDRWPAQKAGLHARRRTSAKRDRTAARRLGAQRHRGGN